MIQVLLYSAEPMLRAGLEALLRPEDRLNLTASCDTVAGLLREAERHPADVVLVEADAAITAAVLRKVAANPSRTPVVLWVAHSPTTFLAEAIALGVRGILRKNLPVESFTDCLREVARGGLWIERELAHRILLSHPVHLTPRERQILALVGQGLKNKEIAWELGLVEGTVKVCLNRLFKKVGATDRLDLAMYALANVYWSPPVEAPEAETSAVRRVRRVVHRVLPTAS